LRLSPILFGFLAFTNLMEKSDADFRAALETVVQRTQDDLLSRQVNGDHWDFPSYLGTHYISLYSVLLKWFERPASATKFTPEYLLEKLRATQNRDGSWFAIYDANRIDNGDLTATIYNYFALKVYGNEADEFYLTRAKNYILAHGGIETAPLLTRVFMAMFGNADWEGIPEVPALLFRKISPVNAKSFSQWVIPHILPISYLRRYKVTKILGPKFDLSEIRISSRKKYKGLEFSGIASRRWFVRKMLKSQQPKGTWGAYTISSLLTLACLDEYSKGHESVESHRADLATEKSFRFIEHLYFDNKEGQYLGVLDDGHYWDTALISSALLESGVSPNRIWSSAQYLAGNQTKNGGIPFGFDFEYAPDVDDTAATLWVYRHYPQLKENSKKAVEWILKMQNSDGGWAAFDRNNNGNAVLKIFAKGFMDSADLFDESSPDIVGHVLEALGGYGYDSDRLISIRPAIQYLVKTQNKERGYWSARWGINSVYGTSAVLMGLLKVTSDRDHESREMIDRGVQFIRSCQNDDGGWGESSQSYNDEDWICRGVSTPSQTAWALLPLIEAYGEKDAPVIAGIEYLLQFYRSHGEWFDPSTVGTGHPGLIYMNYPSYPWAFPLIAISRYLKAGVQYK